MNDLKSLIYTSILLPEAPQQLIIDDKGVAGYTSYTNMGAMEVPEIGYYQTVIDEAEMRSLTTVLNSGPVANLPDHSNLVIPSGIETQMLDITFRDQVIKKIVSAADPVDPGLKAVFAHLEGMVKKVKRGPVKTIRLETVKLETGPDGSLAAVVEVKNSGKEDVCFRSLGDIVKNSNGQLFLEAWPKTALSGSMWSEQKITVSPLTVELLEGAAPLKNPVLPDMGYLQLSPGEAVQYKLSGKFEGATKEYIGRIYMNNSQSLVGEQEVVMGEIYGSQSGFTDLNFKE